MNDRLVAVRNLLREAAEAQPTPHSPLGQRILHAASAAMASILNDPDHPFTRFVREIEWKPADKAAGRCSDAPAEWFY